MRLFAVFHGVKAGPSASLDAMLRRHDPNASHFYMDINDDFVELEVPDEAIAAVEAEFETFAAQHGAKVEIQRRGLESYDNAGQAAYSFGCR